MSRRRRQPSRPGRDAQAPLSAGPGSSDADGGDFLSAEDLERLDLSELPLDRDQPEAGEVSPAAPSPQPARVRPPKLEILHVDEHLIVVNKPPGVLAAPGRGKLPWVGDIVRAMPGFAPNEPIRIVHRIDRDASGVVIYARTADAQRALVRQFAARQVDKLYYALVSGYVHSAARATDQPAPEFDGEINRPLRFDKRRARMVARGGGKPALTRYRILQRLPGNTWLECRPVTGRTHQIRVHMAAIGHPLSVDPLYGGGEQILLSFFKRGYRPSTRHAERPLIDRLTLHSARIAFVHPGSGQIAIYEAPLPKDLRATLNQLGRLARD